MNYQLLYDEISRDVYAGMTDAQTVAALNAETTVRRRVPIAELQARAMETGVYTALRAAVASAQVPDDLKAVCQTVLDLAQARFADVDMDNAASQQMFGVIQQAGIITSQQAAAIDALTTVAEPSWSARNVGRDVTEADLAVARVAGARAAIGQRAARGYNAVVDAIGVTGGVPVWADLVAVFEATE